MMTRLIILALVAGAITDGAASDESGFVAIFNGQDLSGWSGDPDQWRVVDGTITGQSTTQRPVATNTFLIWEGEVANFELQAEFKLTGETANSGIQYRSRVLDAKTWTVGGYQADMDILNRFTGMLYEERGRGILLRPGQRGRIGPSHRGHQGQSANIMDLGGGTAKSRLQEVILPGQWNRMHIVARGNHLQHFVNGTLTAEAYDDDPDLVAFSGVLALQLHSGPPMTIQFRDLRLKALPGELPQ